ncbi:MAG: Trp family transcriptional regulator [Patescibacteria group bacterium]
MGGKRESIKKKNSGEKRLAALPPINKFHSRKEWEVACWEKILKSPELLRLLITSHERHNLVMRVAALDAINSGRSYRQISKELWLSLQTISGIKKAINERGYRSYLERSKKERRKRIYSASLIPPKPEKPKGKPRRTKYGTVYIPYY